MVQTKNVQAVMAAAMAPVIRAGRVNPVDWDMVSVTHEMAGAQRSLSPYKCL
jgi:hypothetical protein